MVTPANGISLDNIPAGLWTAAREEGKARRDLNARSTAEDDRRLAEIMTAADRAGTSWNGLAARGRSRTFFERAQELISGGRIFDAACLAAVYRHEARLIEEILAKPKIGADD